MGASIENTYISRYGVLEASAHHLPCLRSEEIVIRKMLLFMVIMETLKYTCIPSLTSIGCIERLRSEKVVTEKRA